MILFLGIVTSYEDIKFGKIRNKWILFSISYSILIYLYLFLLNNNYGLNLKFILGLLLNSILALIVGFLMWNVGLWRAGDAKLFFSFVILMPYSQSYFSFVNILSFTFIPISLFFLATSILKTSYKEKRYYFKKTFNIKAIITIILFIFGVSWLISPLFQFLGLKINILLSLFFIFLVYYFVENIIKIRLYYIALLLSVLRLILDPSVYSLYFVYQLIALTLLFLIIRIFIISMSSKYFANELKFSELKEGMIPAEIIFLFKGKYYKKPRRFFIFSFKKKKVGKLLFKNYNELTKEAIDRLNSLQKRLPFKTLRIQTTIPFAPFMLLGVLLTLTFDIFTPFL